ncbi:unnamed protein product [Phytophthora fragariaefolia]|uniref:Unnamed protein product n=1 Tax=Phytophthora fragariaefolia TaxID=1490495 RepID=A0A9W6XG24_9STRA|nr:unnamed protein product [Phytophthora fragariaefolia]
MRPDLPTDFALRRDLLRAQSFGDMLDVLRANTAESASSTKELAELRVQNAKLTRDNQDLLQRLESALADSTRFEHDLATVVRECDKWKRHATNTSELVVSFRNTVCVLELQLRESTRQTNHRVDSCQQLGDHLRRMVDQRDKDLKRMSEVLDERDIAYSALQGVASSYFEQVQEAAAVISSGGADRALRFANQTIDNQRRVIQRQKNVLRHNGRILVTNPALALAAAAGVDDAPGLLPGDLALNARLCRLLEPRWPELSQVQPGEVREITLRVSGPVAPSSAPVSLPLSSAAPTSSSSAAGLAMTPADFHVPSPSVHVSASCSILPSGSTASAAPVTSSASLVSSMVAPSAPESTARPLHAVSAGSVSSSPPSTRRASPQPTKDLAGSTSKSARKSPTNSAAGSSRRAPRNSASAPSSTSTVAPAPSITGFARSQRASALNARAINSLELQALETSDAEVLGWSSGAASSGARATSASSPLVIDSPSPPAATPTPAPVVTPASQRQSSSDDSDDDEAILQRSHRLHKKSVVESDESADSVAEALEEKPASPLTPVPVSPAPSTGQKRPSSPSASRARPAAKSNKAAKSATKTARGTAQSGKSVKAAAPTTPASGTAAVSAPTSSAFLGQASNSAGGATSLPDVLRLPILTLRTRTAQAVSRDSRVPAQMKISRDPPFFHLGSARCWDQVMGSCEVEIQKETVDGKPRFRSTPSSLSGLAAFADVSAIVPQVGSSRRDRGGVLAQVPHEMAKVFVAHYERIHGPSGVLWDDTGLTLQTNERKKSSNTGSGFWAMPVPGSWLRHIGSIGWHSDVCLAFAWRRRSLTTNGRPGSSIGTCPPRLSSLKW